MKFCMMLSNLLYEEAKIERRNLIKLKITKHKKIFIISVLIGISLLVLGGINFQTINHSDRALELKTPKIMELEQSFAEQGFLKILHYDEWLLNQGIELSSEYNRSSLNHDSGKKSDFEYLIQLLTLKKQYEKYITSVKNYDWKQDESMIVIDSLKSEFAEINHKKILLKNSKSDIPYIENHEKFSEFLPSMFLK